MQPGDAVAVGVRLDYTLQAGDVVPGAVDEHWPSLHCSAHCWNRL